MARRKDSRRFEPPVLHLAEAARKVAYEIWMFRESVQLFLAPGPRCDVEHNLALEGTLLHGRTIMDFFVGPPTAADDVCAAHFLPPEHLGVDRWWTSRRLPHLLARRTDINKHLSHLTYTRVTEKPLWNDIDLIAADVAEALREFLGLLLPETRAMFGGGA